MRQKLTGKLILPVVLIMKTSSLYDACAMYWGDIISTLAEYHNLCGDIISAFRAVQCIGRMSSMY